MLLLKVTNFTDLPILLTINIVRERNGKQTIKKRRIILSVNGRYKEAGRTFIEKQNSLNSDSSKYLPKTKYVIWL